MEAWLTSSRLPSVPSACRGSAEPTRGRSLCSEGARTFWACAFGCIPGTCLTSRTSCCRAIALSSSCMAASDIATRAARRPRRRRATLDTYWQSFLASSCTTSRSRSSWPQRAGGYSSRESASSPRQPRRGRLPPGWQAQYARAQHRFVVAHLLSHLRATMRELVVLASEDAGPGNGPGKPLERM